MPADQEGGDTCIALAAAFKRPFNLEGANDLMKKYKVVDSVDNAGEAIELVAEAKNVETEDGVTRFELHWDKARQWNDQGKLRIGRETQGAGVRLREGPSGPMAFIYTNAALAPVASPQVSYALFRTYGQLVGIEPTPGLFQWLLDNHVGTVLRAGFKVTGIKDLKWVDLRGDLTPATSVDRKRYEERGELRSLTYESSDGMRRFSASTRGMYSVHGAGVDADELEEYVLGTVIPHLSFTAR